MSEMILLGAGASVDAGIPDAYQMTSDIANLANAQAESVEYDAVRTDARRVINFVLGGLLFDLAQANQNPIGSGVNVEDLFATVQLLANRNSLEVAPFVGAWHSMIEALDQIHPPPPDLEGFVNEVIEASAEQGANSARISMGGYSSSSRITRDPRDIARDLQGVLEANHSKPGDGGIFRRTARWMLEILGKLVWVEDSSTVSYLFPLVNRARNGKTVTIATLNYDNTVELAAHERGVLCKTGIEGWSKNGAISFTEGGIHLIKLHGSINWSSKPDVCTLERPMPHTEVKKMLSYPPPMPSGWGGHSNSTLPGLIFGQRNKLTADGPYLDLLRQFQYQLSQSKSLIVVGYSFRDEHINTYISQWLNSSWASANKITIVDPYLSKLTCEYMQILKWLPKERLNLIESPAIVALPSLFPDED